MTERGVRKRLTGLVINNNMDNTAVVLVNTLKKHKTYVKYVRSQTKYLAHDPQDRCQIGDKVTIIEARPISKRKRWQVIEIIETGVKGDLENDNGQPLEQVK